MNLTRLNGPQREAVAHNTGPLLVLAGAGSGKTRVITHRIARLMQDGVLPQHIAALTFTNKAAAEMRKRVAGLLGKDKSQAQKLVMGTFHSLGLQILKEERKALGYPRGFVIYDTSDQLGVLREILRRLRDGDRRYDVKSILTRISLAKNAFVGPDEYSADTQDEYDEITAHVYPKYQQALRNFAALDFDDLITEVVNLFARDAAVSERWAQKFRYLLVDEYQDTNRAQLMMIRGLIARHNNLCVVGDDDQSIYSWRGADTSNILGFEKMFPGAKVVKLEQNYRSTKTILDAANAVIENNTDRYGKKLWSAHPEGPAIIHAIAPEASVEARFVAEEIERVHSEEQRPYKHFAILYRSNRQAKIFEEELRERQIPYTMVGGQQFFERKEVKDIIAYLRVALNPRDEISLRRILNYPARGIGANTVERVTAWCASERTPFWNGLCRIQELDVRPKTKRAVLEFTGHIRALGAELDQGRPITGAVRNLLEAIDLYSDLRAASPTIKVAQRRIENVESLIASLGRHEERNPGKGQLIEYLRKLSLESEDDKSEPGDVVLLTTLHGSKGLEFPVVFLVGWEEDLLPHARTVLPTLANVSPEEGGDVGEERRLAYVGITRAQHTLYVSRTTARWIRGKPVPRTPSRFLMEIPAELTSERNIAAELQAPVEAEDLSSFFSSVADSLS